MKIEAPSQVVEIYRSIKQMILSYSKFMQIFEFAFYSPVTGNVGDSGCNARGGSFRINLQLFALDEPDTSS